MTANIRMYKTVPAGWSFRRIASWLSILLLAANVLTSASLPARVVDAELFPSIGGLLGNVSEICHFDNYGGTDQSAPPGTHHKTHCGFCTPLAHAGLDVPTTISLPLSLAAVAIGPIALSHQQPTIAPRLRTSISPRAPPLA